MVLSPIVSSASGDCSFDEAFRQIQKRIQSDFSSDPEALSERLTLLNELSRFPLGQHLILNRGMNGYWTHYVCTYPRSEKMESLSPLEYFLLAERPLALATQERFEIFLSCIQEKISDGIRMASIPSGLMGDLLLLNFDGIKDFQLTGIDLDPESLACAKNLAEEKGLQNHLSLICQDAWSLAISEEFDLIASSGLTIYIDSEEKIDSLFHIFYRALKAEGTLVTSFLSMPPWASSESPWRMDRIDSSALRKQKIIYQDILQFTGICSLGEKRMKSHLEKAGFSDLEFFYDKAGIFPTVRAKKTLREK